MNNPKEPRVKRLAESLKSVCITFSLKIKVRAKISKRKMFNYKKANWDSLNNDLKYFRCDQHLKFCDVETGWHRFKNILSQKLSAIYIVYSRYAQ